VVRIRRVTSVFPWAGSSNDASLDDVLEPRVSS
jgi:hypothetical protein